MKTPTTKPATVGVTLAASDLTEQHVGHRVTFRAHGGDYDATLTNVSEHGADRTAVGYHGTGLLGTGQGTAYVPNDTVVTVIGGRP